MEGVGCPSIQPSCEHFAWLLGLLDSMDTGGEIQTAGQVGHLLLDIFHDWLSGQHHPSWSFPIVSYRHTTGEGSGNTYALGIGIVVLNFLIFSADGLSAGDGGNHLRGSFEVVGSTEIGSWLSGNLHWLVLRYPRGHHLISLVQGGCR